MIRKFLTTNAIVSRQIHPDFNNRHKVSFRLKRKPLRCNLKVSVCVRVIF